MSPNLGKTVRDFLLRRRSGASEAAPTSADAMIVRRDLSPAYYGFLRVFTKTNGLDLVVDRRVGERRKGFDRFGAGRRLQDRRGEQPATWEEGDFIVVQAQTGSAHLGPSARIPEFRSGRGASTS